MKKVLLTIVAAAALALTPSALVSAEADITQTAAGSYAELPDNRELEAAYLEKLFYGDGIAPLADYGRDTLAGNKLALYEALRTKIESIAEGDVTDTVISIPVSGYSDWDSLAADAEDVIKYLLVDMPEEFYWYDKVRGCSIIGEIDTNRIPTVCRFSFTVAGSYAGDTAYTVNPYKMSAAKTAVENAQDIVDRYIGSSDHEKIMGYAESICELTDYNNGALAAGTPYGDPWQLVYVFDGDDTTKVVCEGYAKAFQYLCDLGGVDCYTVTGTMSGGTGAGGHMWNIVRLGEISYLVDVTNCDGNSVGTVAEDGMGLVLKGAASSTAAGCVFKLNDLYTISYTYDSDTLRMYPEGLLEVSTVDHDPLPSVCSHEFDGWESDENGHWQVCAKCGEKIGEAEHSRGVITTPATETTEGERRFECTVCGRELGTETIPAFGDAHDHDCTISNSNETEHWKECECGYIDETTREAHKQAEREETVIQPTCAAEGLKYVITYCADCGREISRNSESVAKTNRHTESAKYSFSPAGHWKVCTVCGEKITATRAHTSDNGTVTTHPTETSAGVKTYKCTECGYIIKTESVPIVGHEPEEDWTADATGHWHACANCDERLEFAAHTSNEGIVTVPATETTPGKRVYKCTICEYVIRTETIPMIGHTHTPAEAWTTDATGHWHDCAGCEERLYFAAHTSDKGTVTTPATTTTAGVMTYKCTVCGYVIRTEEIPAGNPGHTHTPAEAWTYDSEGHWHACAGCDDKIGYQAHNLVNGVCGVCGYSNIVDPKVSIVIDPASVTLHAGDTKTITAVASKGGLKIEDAVFTWRSDKESVIKINSKGVATAVGVGTANVTAEYAGIKASCAVTVEARPVVTLTPSSLQMRKSADYTLKIKVTVGGKAVDNPAIEWSSSNTDIVTVDGGVVTAIKAGTATVTAEYDGVKAVCSVTVRTTGSTSTSVTRPTYRPSSTTNYDDDEDDTADTANSTATEVSNKAK
ncbi:MAG: Ig-like domain-containing protein, partial [Oscillospiraceae bacterium]|nr:Ig-like domain-containing protein [Oscillospiraceae bacterium]